YKQLKRDINDQLAQTYLEIGDIDVADNILLENIDQKDGLYWHNKARVYASKGDYKNAIFCSDKAIAIKKHLPTNSPYVMPLYLRKIEYLNYLGEYENVYNMCLVLYDAENISINSKTYHAVNLLMGLARAEVAMGKK